MPVEAARRVHAVPRAVDALDLGEASHELLDGARDAAERVGDERDDGVAQSTWRLRARSVTRSCLAPASHAHRVVAVATGRLRAPKAAARVTWSQRL